MSLTADQVCDVLNGLQREGKEEPKAPERRRGQRVHQLGWAEIDDGVGRAASDHPPTATIHDIGTRGVGIAVDHAIHRGERFVLKFRRAGEEPLPVQYRVVSERRVADDLYSIGAELVAVM